MSLTAQMDRVSLDRLEDCDSMLNDNENTNGKEALRQFLLQSMDNVAMLWHSARYFIIPENSLADKLPYIR